MRSHQISRSFSIVSETRTIMRQKLQENPKHMRIQIISDSFMQKTRSELLQKQKCCRCYLKHSLCICSRIENALQTLDQSIHYHFDLLSHFKEFGDSSNSGKLISIGLPFHSTNTIYGSKVAESLLIEKLMTSPSLILYPGVNSRPIEEYKDWFINHDKKVRFCVIDSTWNLSRAMTNIFPSSIPQANITNFITAPSLFLNRKQVAPKKVSTVEAIALCLRGLGESENIVDPIINALKISVDASLVSSFKKVAYHTRSSVN